MTRASNEGRNTSKMTFLSRMINRNPPVVRRRLTIGSSLHRLEFRNWLGKQLPARGHARIRALSPQWNKITVVASQTLALP